MRWGQSAHVCSRKSSRASNTWASSGARCSWFDPPGVHYSLTDEGLHVARLGEPVFLYLRLMRGLLAPGRRDSTAAAPLAGGGTPG